MHLILTSEEHFLMVKGQLEATLATLLGKPALWMRVLFCLIVAPHVFSLTELNIC